VKCKTCKYEERSELVTPCRSCDDNSSEYVAIEPDPRLALMGEMEREIRKSMDILFDNGFQKQGQKLYDILIRYNEMKQEK